MSSKEENKDNIFTRVGKKFSNTLKTKFEYIGLQISQKPYIFISISFTIFMIFTIGFYNFTIETRPEQLWIPTDTEARNDRDFVYSLYPKLERVVNLIITSKSKESNILVPETFDTLYNIHNQLVYSKIENPFYNEEDSNQRYLAYDINGTDSNVYKLCYNRGTNCYAFNILDAFEHDPNNWATVDQILEVINNDDKIVTATGEPYDKLVALGGVTTNGNSSIIEAKAIEITYFIENNEVSKSSGNEDEMARAWELFFLDAVNEINVFSNYSLYRYTTASGEMALEDALEDDVLKVYIGTMILFIYATVVISRWSEGIIGSRLLLMFGGTISIGLAIVSGLGLMSFLDIFYTNLTGIYPILILGIGMDDIFVLINNYDNTSSDLTLTQRISKALGIAGPSITVTSLTDFFAFIIGSNSSLPALKAFCIVSAIGILFTYFFQITFFAPIVTYDEKRRLSNRSDILPCIKSKKEPLFCLKWSDDKLLEHILEKIGNFLTNIYSKILVIITFSTILGFGLYGAINIETMQSTELAYPKGTLDYDYYNVNTKYMTEVGTGTALYIQNLNISDPDVRLALTELFEIFKNADSTVSDMTSSWFETFKLTVDNYTEIPDDLIFDNLIAWLNNTDTGNIYSNDIILNHNEKNIESCRFRGYHFKRTKSNEKADLMDSLRDIIKSEDVPELLRENTFAFGYSYEDYENSKLIGQEFFTNITLSLIMILIIISLLLINPIASIITFFSIAAVITNEIGYLYWWDNTIDNVSTIGVVVTLGLCVDYSLHIAHCFLHAEGTPNERMIKAMKELGPSVIHGGLSTYIAISLLANSSSYIFLTFFKSFFLCVLMGIMHGVILVPVLMSIAAPKTQ